MVNDFAGTFSLIMQNKFQMTTYITNMIIESQFSVNFVKISCNLFPKKKSKKTKILIIDICVLKLRKTSLVFAQKSFIVLRIIYN